MTWHFSVYTPIFMLNVALSLWIAFMVWRHSTAPGAKVISITLAAAAFWSFFHLFEISVDQTWAKIFWTQVQYLGSNMIGPSWFIFTVYYRSPLKRLPRRSIALLAIIPVATVALAFSNNLHHLIWPSITPIPDSPGALRYAHGIAFWISISYQHVLVLFGNWNIYQVLRAAPPDQKSRTRALLIGALAPTVGSLLYVAGLSPIQGQDLTPFFLTVTGMVYLLAVLRYRLFDIRRVARAAIIDIMRDGMLIVDEKNRLVDVNPSALTFLTLPAAFIGQDIHQTLAQYPAILAIILNPKEQAVTVAVAAVAGAIGDDETQHLDVQVTGLQDTMGKPAGKLVVLRDVSERLTAEKAAFEVAIEQHRHQLLTRFIRDISHEFRTPLSVVNTSLYLMEKSDDPAHQKYRRELIQLQTKRVDALISEMLMIVQIDAHSTLEMTRIDLDSLILSVTHEQQPIFSAKRQELIVQPTSQAIQIAGDLPLLQKAIANILQNASRYTPDDGKITVTGKSEGGMALIEIADSGIGMSAETQTHIFERFFRADDAHSTPGFGLGLPISQMIIEKHHGQIDVQSTFSAGSTFTIRLPQYSGEVIPIPAVRFAAT